MRKTNDITGVRLIASLAVDLRICRWGVFGLLLLWVWIYAYVEGGERARRESNQGPRGSQPNALTSCPGATVLQSAWGGRDLCRGA